MTTDLEQKIGLVTSSSSDDRLSIIHPSIYARSLTNSNVIYVYLFTLFVGNDGKAIDRYSKKNINNA